MFVLKNALFILGLTTGGFFFLAGVHAATGEKLPQGLQKTPPQSGEPEKGQKNSRNGPSPKALFPEVQPFRFDWKEGAFLTFGADAEVGYVNDQALYASFGLETQVMRLSKLVLGLGGGYETTPGMMWFFKLDLALLYDGLRYKASQPKIYGQDKEGRNIDGANIYNDWYKNLGSRLYDVGNVPLVEALVGFRTARHQVRVGRMKNTAGFADQEIPWGDDGKFAPMAAWLVRDLLTGLAYELNTKGFQAGAAVFSGANAMKGGGRYLEGVQTPNLKANNTPTLEGFAKFVYADFLPENIQGFVGLSTQKGTKGSSWSDALGEGKHQASFVAANFLFRYHFDRGFVNALGVWGQLTQYESGLSPSSCQNNGHPRFKTFKQKGFFVGVDMRLFEDVVLWAAFERIRRMDFGLFKALGYPSSHHLNSPYQTSFLAGARWFFKPFSSLELGYHRLRNPARFASDIWDKRGDTRTKATLKIQF